MMPPRTRAILRLLVLLGVAALLLFLFPAAFRFAEGAARSIVRLWWLVLLVALAVWLLWASTRRPKP